MLIILGQFFLCLSILIVLHEAGHFVAARMFNTKVEKFYLFFNPWFSLFKKKIGDTTYGVGWLPLGGYVKIAGMIDESMDQEQMNKPAEEWEFRSKPRWQRLIIMLGGVVVNFILAFCIYVFMFGYWGEKIVEQKPLSVYSETIDLNNFPLKNGDRIVSINDKKVKGDCWRDVKMDLVLWGDKNLVVYNEKVGKKKTITFSQDHINSIINRAIVIDDIPFEIDSVLEGSAKDAGLIKGDLLKSINGQEISGRQGFVSFFQKNEKKSVLVGFERSGLNKFTKLDIPQKDENGNVLIGVSVKLPNEVYINHSFFSSFPAAIKKTKKEIVNYLGQFGLLFKMDDGAKQLGGFITIGSLFGSTWDWEHFWGLTAFISIMLAIVNLLPIPALDGGHVLILLIEMIIGRDINPKILGYIQVVGMVLLLGLFILANVNDVIRLFQ